MPFVASVCIKPDLFRYTCINMCNKVCHTVRENALTVNCSLIFKPKRQFIVHLFFLFSYDKRYDIKDLTPVRGQDGMKNVRVAICCVDTKVPSWNRCTVYNVYVPSGLYLFTIFPFFPFSHTTTRSPTLNSFCISVVS